MRKSNNTFYTLLAVVITIIAFFVCWQMIIPEYKENKAELAKTESELNAAKEKLDSLVSAKETISSLGTIVEKMFVSVSEDEDKANLITELEAIAKKHQTYIPTIQISSAKSSQSTEVISEEVGATSDTQSSTVATDSISISFGVAGTFQSLNEFIVSLENNIKFFKVKSLSLSGGEGDMSLAVQIEAYKRPNVSLTSLTQETLPTEGM